MLAAPLKGRTTKRIIVIVIILILGSLLVPSVVSADSGTSTLAGTEITGKTGDGNWIDNTWKVTMYPGEQKSTTITLSNRRPKDITLTLSVTPSIFDDGNVIINLDNSTLIVPAKSEACAVISASATGSATPETYSAEIRIEALPPPLSVTTNNATRITWFGSTLNGRLDNLGNFSSVSVSFVWGTTSGYLDKETRPKPKRRAGAFSARLQRLSPNTTYYFRAKAEGDGTIVYGDEFNFTTQKPGKAFRWLRWFWWWW